jgi:transposase
MRLLNWYNGGNGTIPDAAEHFAVGDATASRWVARYKRTGEVKSRRAGGGNGTVRLSAADLDVIRAIVDDDPSLTVDQINDRFVEATTKVVSRSTMSRALQKLGFTRKKNSPRIDTVETPRVKEHRSAFGLAAKALDARNLVFLDEFGSNLAMVPRYARAPAGVRVHINKPSKRGKNVTFVGALTLDGLLTLDALPGSATIINFVAWVRDVLVPLLRAGQVVIMDNLNAHRSDIVRELIEAAGASVLLLPPYSPDLNPIEESWSKVKSFLRAARARSHEALLLAAEMAAAMVTPSDARGWFSHAGYASNQHA